MREIAVERRVLERNDALARGNRERFRRAGAYAVNLISSPGTGKTALLEATLGKLATRLRVGVVEGDVQTENDARRIAATGVPVEAVVTGQQQILAAIEPSGQTAHAGLESSGGGGMAILAGTAAAMRRKPGLPG